nr:pro-sigmaK processing inhibitor BofA family protein [Mediterraneibacter sp.]
MGRKILSAAVNFIVRAVVGMALIFFINQYVIPPESSINVGLNAVSFLTSGMLGIPGVGLLYGIVCYQVL